MKDLGPGNQGVADEASIVPQYPRNLSREAGIPLLAPTQVEKVEPWTGTELGAVQIIAPDEIEAGTPREERRCQAQRVGPVGSAGQQSHCALEHPGGLRQSSRSRRPTVQ